MVVPDKTYIAGPRSAAGPGGYDQPLFHKLHIHKYSCVTVIARCPSGIYGKNAQTLVCHVSLALVAHMCGSIAGMCCSYPSAGHYALYTVCAYALVNQLILLQYASNVRSLGYL